MLPVISLAVSGLSLVVAATTAWLTLWRRGRVRMGQPPTIYFGPDGARERQSKVFVRALLYATAARGRIVEGMYARLTRGDSAQTFSVWVCGEGRGALGRGVGLAVRPDGAALDHHFLLPRDGTTYRFLAGVYKVELFVVLVGRARPMKLRTVELTVTEPQATALNEDPTSGLYFDWSPETGRYHGHIDNAKLPDLPPPMILFAHPPPELVPPKLDPPAKAVDK
jgi:hypothetical protein